MRTWNFAILLMALASVAVCQTPVAGDATQEQNELNLAMQEAGNSPVDVIRALERHLAKYPQTAQRATIEQSLVKTAIQINDGPRICSMVKSCSPTPRKTCSCSTG